MTDIIVSEIKNSVGIITLNSPKSLNSLSLEMAKALINKLNEWKNNDSVRCILMQGNARAFCAGGDVRKLYESLIKNGPGELPADVLEFFIHEYKLDYNIHKYSKPIVVWGDSIVMGGGIGLMVGASHRIVTENSKLAMPEITIGLYPDVGGTYFLNRMPAGWGKYFGLTGARMNAGDALYLGLADYFIASEKKENVIEKMTTLKWSIDPKEDANLLNDFFKIFNKPVMASPVREHAIFAQQLSNIKSVKEFDELLLRESASDQWLALGYKSFKAGSPTSAMVIFEQLHRGKDFNLEQVFYSELNLSVHFSMEHDFPEGVRALLVDKDLNPRWQASPDSVDSYFTQVWNPHDHPLKSLINKS